MNLIPRGCANIGGELASRMEHCRNQSLDLFASYGYRPFSPAEFQLLEGTWERLSKSHRRRLLTLNSPFGEACCLRADLTLSAVTYLATHFAPEERPLRLCYADRVYSAPTPPHENLEVNQIGIELLGWEGQGADVEVLALLLRTLDNLELNDGVIVLGDTSIASHLFAPLQPELSETLVELLQKGQYTAYREALAQSQLSPEVRRTLLEFPYIKGDPEVLNRAETLLLPREWLQPLRHLTDCLSQLGYAKRLRVDLGFIRDLGYYSGPVFNVYASATGPLIGGGGRYDGLLTEIGLTGQAIGFGLNLRELARCCLKEVRKTQTLIWAGQMCPADALLYAERLSSLGIPFELSWHSDPTASLNLAKTRRYTWWINGAEKYVTLSATGEVLPLAAFEKRAQTC